jgi:hypothetical protein
VEKEEVGGGFGKAVTTLVWLHYFYFVCICPIAELIVSVGEVFDSHLIPNFAPDDPKRLQRG